MFLYADDSVVKDATYSDKCWSGALTLSNGRARRNTIASTFVATAQLVINARPSEVATQHGALLVSCHLCI